MVDALGERDGDHKWACPEVAVVLPRQNGKGVLLEAKALHSLFLSGARLILWSAHEFKTAREGFLRIRDLVTNCDHLRRRVERVRTSHGEESVILRDGARLQFVARSRGSGRGFPVDDVIFDEAFALTDEHMAAMIPTISARPNAQIWYTSSAPLAHSSVLRRLCLRGRKADPGLAYLEWSADPATDPDDRQAWADANPALGIRISEEAVQRELGAMAREDFRRERLGIASLSEDGEQIVDPDVWRARADPGSQITGQVAFALDVTPDRSSASIGVAGLREDGLRHTELVGRMTTQWLVHRLCELVGKWDVAAVALDATSPAASLIPELERAGIKAKPERGDTRLEIVGASAMAQACGGWYDAVVTDRLRHLDQAPLNAAVSGAQRRASGDTAWRWWRRESAVDITPLVAVTLADYAFALHADDGKPAVEPWFSFGYGD